MIRDSRKKTELQRQDQKMRKSRQFRRVDVKKNGRVVRTMWIKRKTLCLPKNVCVVY